MKKARICGQLFAVMLYISAFTFGGGFVIVTLMKKHFVDRFHWIDNDEMLDMTAIAQSCPGAIAVNASILVGRRVAGIPGMFSAVLATIIPPVAILSILSACYEAFSANPYVACALSGMQAGVAAVIADVVLNLYAGAVKKNKVRNTVLMLAAFVCAFFLKVNVVWLILGTALIGLGDALLRRKAVKD